MTDIYRAETVRLIMANFENENSELKKLASSFKIRRIWLNTKNIYTINPAKPTPKDDKDSKNKNQEKKNK